MNPTALLQTQQVFQSELRSGESLVWCGQPSTSVIFHAFDWFSIPFSIMWGGFALFWECSVTNCFHSVAITGSSGFFALWGIPFVLAGQYLIWGRFIYDWWLKRRTFYAITNQRVLVITRGFKMQFFENSLGSMETVSRSEVSNGLGTIHFASDEAYAPRARGRSAHRIGISLNELAFHDIADVRNVYEVLQAQREAGERNSTLPG